MLRQDAQNIVCGIEPTLSGSVQNGFQDYARALGLYNGMSTNEVINLSVARNTFIAMIAIAGMERGKGIRILAQALGVESN